MDAAMHCNKVDALSWEILDGKKMEMAGLL